MDFVNRRPDGGFLLGVAGYGETVAVPYVPPPKSAQEIEQDGKITSICAGLRDGWLMCGGIEVDAAHLAIAKHYFAKETKTTKAQQEGE